MQNGLATNGVHKEKLWDGRLPVPVAVKKGYIVGNGKLPTTLQMELMVITPELAAIWLERNTKNRPKRLPIIKRYARDMKCRDWRLSGDTIKFDKNGALLDGQHRLMAAIESDCSFRSYVCFGLEPDVFINIDSHVKRKPSDFLAICGELNPKALSQAAVNALCYAQQKYADLGHSRFTNDEIFEFIERNPDIRASVGTGLRLKGIVKPGLAAALHYYSLRSNRKRAEVFWRGLIDGAGLSATSPIRILRERLIADRISSNRHEAVRSIDTAALIIKAFNAFTGNKPMTCLKWNSRGKTAQPFPTFVGDNS